LVDDSDVDEEEWKPPISTKITQQKRIRTNGSKKKFKKSAFASTTSEKSKTFSSEQDKRDARDDAIGWPFERRRFVDSGLVGVERVVFGTCFARCQLLEFNQLRWRWKISSDYC
jgi:hypothetical protein